MKTPVLLLIFNRPEMIRSCLERLRAVRPRRVFVAADGPGSSVALARQCAEARNVLREVDWPCDLRRRFLDEHAGCRVAVSGAVDWFFEEVEEGIILEDDCHPTESFFDYCEALLVHYRRDSRIMDISGFNGHGGKSRDGASYYFSQFGVVWGWATWRRAWAQYDREMKLWPRFRELGYLEEMFPYGWLVAERRDAFERTYRGEVDTWDYQWTFAKLAAGGLSTTPCVNLVRNAGFGGGGTHTTDARDPRAAAGTGEIEFPLRHPRFVVPERYADLEYVRQRQSSGGGSRVRRALRDLLGGGIRRVSWPGVGRR